MQIINSLEEDQSREKNKDNLNYTKFTSEIISLLSAIVHNNNLSCSDNFITESIIKIYFYIKKMRSL